MKPNYYKMFINSYFTICSSCAEEKRSESSTACYLGTTLIQMEYELID